MFAVIYQAYLKPGKEKDYQEAWQLVAEHFMKNRGALGSCLHKTEEGLWIAYSRWPDKKTRDASWPQDRNLDSNLPEGVKQAILAIKDSVDETKNLSEICLDVVNDLLLK